MKLGIEELVVGSGGKILLLKDQPNIGSEEGPAELEMKIVCLFDICLDDFMTIAVFLNVLDPLLWDGVVGTIVEVAAYRESVPY